MKRFPREFEELLSREGLKVLQGTHPACGVLASGQGRFAAFEGLLDARQSAAVASLLESALGEVLTPMAQPIPRAATWGMKVAYREKLPKTVRVHTAMLDDEKSRALSRARALGLTTLLRSRSFHAFAEALTGYPLRRRWGLQALCYRPGDYSGPHNDHHPDEPLGRDGYTDVHLTFCNRSVRRQLMVYERQAHLSEVASLRTAGGVTCYRLPFWHYTTPLEGSAAARRWVLLGTFLDRFTD